MYILPFSWWLYYVYAVDAWDDIAVPSLGPVSMDKIHYCERFIELMIDLEVQCAGFYDVKCRF